MAYTSRKTRSLFCAAKGLLLDNQNVFTVSRTTSNVATKSQVDPVLNFNNINPNVRAMEYAVRG